MDEHNRNPFASASGRAGGNTSASSNSSFSSSVADTDDDQTIARMLAEDESLRRDGRLGKRLSLEQAISVCHGGLGKHCLALLHQTLLFLHSCTI
ncbi:hypothetical protein Bca4012_030943 [Brassica carinata]